MVSIQEFKFLPVGIPFCQIHYLHFKTQRLMLVYFGNWADINLHTLLISYLVLHVTQCPTCSIYVHTPTYLDMTTDIHLHKLLITYLVFTHKQFSIHKPCSVHRVVLHLHMSFMKTDINWLIFHRIILYLHIFFMTTDIKLHKLLISYLVFLELHVTQCPT